MPPSPHTGAGHSAHGCKTWTEPTRRGFSDPKIDVFRKLWVKTTQRGGNKPVDPSLSLSLSVVVFFLWSLTTHELYDHMRNKSFLRPTSSTPSFKRCLQTIYKTYCIFGNVNDKARAAMCQQASLNSVRKAPQSVGNHLPGRSLSPRLPSFGWNSCKEEETRRWRHGLQWEHH